MTGSEVKSVLQSNGVLLKDVASRLGMSHQAFGARLSVRSVKPDFVRQIEEVVGFNIADQIPGQRRSEAQEMLALLQKKDEQMDRLITLLEQQMGVSDRKKRAS